MEIIDNYLPSYQFKQLQSMVMESQFAWFYNTGTCFNEDPFPQMIHMFYRLESENGRDVVNDPSPMGEMIRNVIKCKNLVRVKGNLNPRTVFHRNTGYHIDYPNMWTSIFYLNTNNGWTQFKKGGKVKCVENRLVTFDSNLEHAGVTCTDEKVRVLINFNYA